MEPAVPDAQPSPSPSVSVIIPARNASRTIWDCVRSVQSAAYEGQCEVIVVDDGSADDTCAIVQSTGCRLLHTRGGCGPAVARNTGAAAANGQILIFVDADTQMRWDSIQEAVRALEAEGVGAVTGMYEPEPLNRGFFPAYYAYLKYYAFTSVSTCRIRAFGAQCAAIHKTLFDRVGGFRPIPWGMDIENDEIGHRIHRYGNIALHRAFRVHHNFPGFRKLLYIFSSRVFWYVLFRHYSRYDETVLMTRGFGLATAALPAAMLSLIAAAAIPAPHWALPFWLASGVGILLFVCGYARFWMVCVRRRGVPFGLAAALASAFFSVVITAGAAWAHVLVGWSSLPGCRKQSLETALENA